MVNVVAAIAAEKAVAAKGVAAPAPEAATSTADLSSSFSSPATSLHLQLHATASSASLPLGQGGQPPIVSAFTAITILFTLFSYTSLSEDSTLPQPSSQQVSLRKFEGFGG